MIKKILLVLILLAGVVALGYYQSTRQQAAQRDQYRFGSQEGEREAAQSYQKLDSLQALMGRIQREFADSLTRAASAHRVETDSLRQIIAVRDQELKLALEKRKSVSGKGNITKAQTIASGEVTQKHVQILSYYKKRLEGLPKDLSEYEKRIAVNEVRDETIRKFSISNSELERIRQNNNLSD